jgi:hypothetical protein
MPACADDAATADGPSADVGRVSLPLIVSGGIHDYRLADVYLVIYGPQSLQLFSSADPGEVALAATLQTGSYTAYLTGWTLERDDGGGVLHPVPATLISSGAVGFSIFNGTTSTISYQFQTDGVLVTVGAGDLKVKATVNEIPAACTPFGADCSAASWCPPTGLTRAPRACIPAGAASIGDPCLSPFDCVANASCVDRREGSGPVCVALCPGTTVGTNCSTGGICQSAGADYGLCHPSLDDAGARKQAP